MGASIMVVEMEEGETDDHLQVAVYPSHLGPVR